MYSGIHHFHHVASLGGHDHDVVGFEVAVDDAEVVGGLETVGALAEEVNGAGQGKRAGFLEHGGERLALHELHGEVDGAVFRLAEVVDRADVGVIDPAGVGGLAIETGNGLRIVAHPGAHHLDGALPPHLDVLGEIDRAHPAFAQLFRDVITVGNNLAYQVAAGVGRPKRLPVALAEPDFIPILRPADRAELHVNSTFSSWSPMRMRDPVRSSGSPRMAIAMPLRLPISVITKSASSLRTDAWSELIEGS
jgi:hypothetical protein